MTPRWGSSTVTFLDAAAGCGGGVEHTYFAPSSCTAEPTFVGLKMYRHPSGRRHVVRGFACARHVDHFDVARLMCERDHVLLELRRERQRVELAGRRWEGEREGPLAWAARPTYCSPVPRSGSQRTGQTSSAGRRAAPQPLRQPSVEPGTSLLGVRRLRGRRSCSARSCRARSRVAALLAGRNA